MALVQKTIAQLTADMVTAWQNNTGVIANLQSGDFLLATLQAIAAQLDYIQAEILTVNNIARAQTSSRSDLDSFMAQFGFTRLPAIQAEGQVTFAKLVAGATAVTIPVGTLVQTPGGAVQYQVIADTTEPTYNATLNAYVLVAGQTSLTATVQALLSGTAYNVVAGQLNQIASSVPGIDTVTNGASINNGANAESDSSFRSSFVAWLNSLSDATYNAILSAVNGVEQGLMVSILENTLPNGSTQNGAFTVVIDNGTGTPGSSLINSVYNAVYATRALPIQPFVVGPTVLTPTIALDIRVASGYTSATVEANVQVAVVTMVNALSIGATLFISSIEEAALSVAGVVAVKPNNTTINSAQADLIATDVEAARITTSDVSVGTY